jgi:protein TonB
MIVAVVSALVIGVGYLAKTRLAVHQHATPEIKAETQGTTAPSAEGQGENRGTMQPTPADTKTSADQTSPSSTPTSSPSDDTPAKHGDATQGDVASNGAGGLTAQQPPAAPQPTGPSQPAQPEAPQRIRVSPADQEGKLVYKPAPKYPDVAGDAHVEGTVLLDAVFGADGRVQDVKLINGHPLLVPAAMNAVRRWRYRPTVVNGKPVEVQTEIAVNFNLRPTATPPPTSSTNDAATVADHLQRGAALAQAGNWDGAIGEYRQVISPQPDSAQADKGLGLALAQKRDWGGEIAALRQAVRLDPKDAEAQHRLGDALGWSGDWHAEISAEKKALSLRPDYPEALYALGVGLEHKGQKQAAFDEYRQAYQLKPNNQTIQVNYNRLAKALGQQ